MPTYLMQPGLNRAIASRRRPMVAGLMNAAVAGALLGGAMPNLAFAGVPLMIRPFTQRGFARVTRRLPGLRRLSDTALRYAAGYGGQGMAIDAGFIDTPYYVVEAGDFPVKIAGKFGRTDWQTLVNTNVGRPRHRDGTGGTFKKGSDGNFETLFAGDDLLIPTSWPTPGQPAPAPGQPPPANPGPLPPGFPDPNGPPPPGWPPGVPWPPPGFPTQPPGGGQSPIPIPVPGGGQQPPGIPIPVPGAPPVPPADIAKVTHVQTMLAFWNHEIPGECEPSDFGQDAQTEFDILGVHHERSVRAMRSYQQWANRTKGESLRTDGQIDQASYDSLAATVAQLAGKGEPGTTKPKKKGSAGLLAAGAALAYLAFGG